MSGQFICNTKVLLDMSDLFRMSGKLNGVHLIGFILFRSGPITYIQLYCCWQSNMYYVQNEEEVCLNFVHNDTSYDKYAVCNSFICW